MVPPRRPSRRAVLSTAAAGLAAIAGCSGGDATPTDSPTDVHTATDSPTDSGTKSPSPTPSGTLSLEPIAPEDADGPVAVHPPDLRGWLRTAATSDETVRAHATVPMYVVAAPYDPTPPILAFDSLGLNDPAGDASGTYRLDAAGGVRYHLLVGAEEASPPDDAAVTPVSSLPESRRDLALAAIGGLSGDDARVYPETKLGSWARTEFVGGYFSHDGTTYRGKEVQQTDAAFFSDEVWYVLSLEATETDPAATLTLGGFDETVSETIADLVSEQDPRERMTATVEGEAAAAAEAFAEDHPAVLTHTSVYRAVVEG